MSYFVRLLVICATSYLLLMAPVSAVWVKDVFVQTLEVPAPCVFPQLFTIKKNETDMVATLSCHTTVSGVLNDANINEDDWYAAEQDALNTHTINIVSVKKESATRWVSVPFITETEYTKQLPHREKVVDQYGKVGVKGQLVETITFEDGTQKEAILSEWGVSDPVTQKVRIGTKYDLQTVVVDGQVVHYWKTLTVLATSYDKTCLGCDSWTATGAYLTKGIVAVDPKVIPLHTSMYVPGYGFGKAEDTGGAVKGDKIDLGFDDLRQGGWSRRWVTIYIID